MSCELLLKANRSKLLSGGLAQLARASALHAEGHRFDSDILHKYNEELKINSSSFQILGNSIGSKWFKSTLSASSIFNY